MSWWGKFIGGTIGMMLGGPLGALIGIAFGHNFDDQEQDEHRGRLNSEQLQMTFYTVTFAVMGYICKADGRVSEDEINLAKSVMRDIDLNAEQRRVAMRLFEEGKKPSFQFAQVVMQLRQAFGLRHNVLRMFLEIQIMAAYADKKLHPAEKEILVELTSLLGFSQSEFEHLCESLCARVGLDSEQSLDQAYAVLGIEPTRDMATVKRVYRRLLNQHHPDKLAAKGLPEEMMKIATERTHQIRKAYERIKGSLGA